MKLKKLNLPLTLACVFCLSFNLSPAVAGATNAPATPRSLLTTVDTDDLGSDFYNGKSYKIGKVTEIKPTYVAVVYADVPGGRKIPRQSLPDKLAALYPYDVEKAAAYEKLQMDITARNIAAQRTIMEESIRRREKELTDRIANLRTQAARLRGDVNIAQHLPGKRARGFRTAIALGELQNVRNQIAVLEDQLTALRKTR